MAKKQGAIQVEGLIEFQRALRAANKDFPKELGAGNKAVADIVATEAQRRSVVKSGRFKKSIRPLKVQRRAQVRMGGARVPYYGSVEFGWPARNIVARPALFPAIAATRDEVIEAYGEMVDNLSRRAFPERASGL